MKTRIAGVLIIGFLILTALWIIAPVTAVTDGPLRRSLEDNRFGEDLIRLGIYAKSGHDVYNTRKRELEHGLPRLTKDFIYEPDVYTWELAIREHRNQIDALHPPPPPPPGTIHPVPMAPLDIPPNSPGEVTLVPMGGGQIYRQLPTDADQRMATMLERARAAGLQPNYQLKAESIKQRLLNHIQDVDSGQNPYPIIPRGRRGDSFDSKY